MTETLLILVYILFACFSFINIRSKCSFAIANQYNTKEQFSPWIFLPLLIFIVVTRPDSLPDINGYMEVIQYNLNNRWEPSFNMLRYIGRKTSSPVFVVFFIYAIISVTGRIYYLKKISPYFWGSMTVYIGYYFIYNDMIQIRAAVATMLLYPIMISSYEKKLKLFLLLVLISTLFHYSSLAYIFIYFLDGKSMKKWWWIGAIFICYALSVTGTYLTPLIGLISWGPVSSLFIHYYDDSVIDENVNIFSLLQIGLVFCALFMSLYINKLKNASPYFIFALKLYIIGICIKTAFSDLPVVANRSGELFTSIEVFLIPTAIYGFFKSKPIIFIINLIYSMIFFSYSLKTWFK